MLKLIGGVCVGLFMTFGTFAQIEVHYGGAEVFSPSDVVDGDADGSLVYIIYELINVSGDDVAFSWTRKELGSINCADEQVCVGESCYVPPAPEEGEPESIFFNSPEPTTLEPNDTAFFKLGVLSEVSCCSFNRYYIKTGLGTVIDSMDVKFRLGGDDCFLSNDDKVRKETIVYPNPAADIFNVTVNNVTNARIDLYNVVGEQVLSTVLTEGTNELNVALLPNGVYFYSVSENGAVLETKKLVVRH